MDSPDLSFSDVGSSISRRQGSQPPMSVYDPYSYRPYPRQYPMYGAPSAQSYYPYGATSAYSGAYSGAYAPSSAYTTYTTYPDTTRGTYSGLGHDNMYFSFNGKLIRSHKIRNYRRAQKHVLDLFPEVLNGVASSRIQFYVTRAGYTGGRYGGLRSYISKKAWRAEMDSLAEHETVGIEVRPSISLTESIVSFFNRSPFM